MLYDTHSWSGSPITFNDLGNMFRISNQGVPLLKSPLGSYVDICGIDDNMTDIEQRLTSVEVNALEYDLNEAIESLRQENYNLQQRLDKLEMLIGEN